MRRFLLFTPALALALAFAGCKDGGTDTPEAGDVDLSSLSPMEQAAFAQGFNMGRQAHPDSTSPFSMDLFMEGFQHGMDGDSSRVSYIAGFQVGWQMRQDTVLRLDQDQFLRGFRFGVDNDSLPLSEADQRRIERVVRDTVSMRELRNSARTDTAAAARLAAGRRNATESEAFLTRLAAGDSVRSTPSGLRYVVVTPGTGASPNPNDFVMVLLSGRLRNGTTLMRSEPNQPVPVQVGAFALEGINEALLDMKPGERRRLYIPPNLAFGFVGLPAQGDQPAVPPSSVVIFDVTLQSVIGPGGMPMGGMPQGMPPGAVPPGAMPPTR